jgi:hypothetical protein
MARYNAYGSADDAARYAAQHPILPCFRRYLSELCFLLYAIVRHPILEHGPEVIIYIYQERLTGHYVNRVLPFVIENDPHRH